ncbi:MAG: lipopolysaccharide transport periplasmic protein LptA [Gemmobacter sp.]
MSPFPAFCLAALLCLPLPALAQGAKVAFGGLKQDTSQPVEITADSLEVNQTDGQATFTGNVLVGQGDLRLSAARIQVEYQADGQGISRLHATGGVTIVNATDAAEAAEAVYTIASGNVVMTGDVVLTQGQNAISGERLVLDLQAGTGVMEGRVKTVFTPGTRTEGGN